MMAAVTTYRPLLNLGDDLAGREVAADGPGVLWLHPYGLDSSCWSALWDELPGMHHVAVDLPGHGRSLPLPDGQDAPGLARRLLALAERRKLRHVVALSSASILALHMAVLEPGALASVVLGSPMPPDGTAAEPFWARYRELVNMHHIAGFGEHLRGRYMLVEPSPFDGVRGRADLWDPLWEVVGRHGFFDLQDAALLRLGQQPDDVKLHGTSVPILIVMGGRDVLAARQHANKLERVLPDCRRLDLFAAGRLSLVEARDVAARGIDAHVRAHDAPAQEER